ncbi:kinase [Guptibacillus hwajinpoensis]|uniref:Uridine kinase n=1 Tax=Guptibacillus hwajinpoensis TaxID=208199 RepID=A0A0J6CPM6_9BACL|nr:kinase [Alkalihalobacillus macyae]KMM38221.1 uridine kinase [Alkalihalobacillus macyae]
MKHNWIINYLLQSRKSDHPLIIGIDGLSRSGKTTFVHQIENELIQKNVRYHTFHIDDHIVERRKRYNTGKDAWIEYYFFQWDIEWLTNYFFLLMKERMMLTLPYYDNLKDVQKLQSVDLAEVELIIVEGVFLQREEWREFFDRVLFLDCPREKRFARENERVKTELEKFQTRYWKAEEFYMTKVNPIEKANFTIRT